MKNVFILGMGEIGSAVAQIEAESGNHVSYLDLYSHANLRGDNAYHVAHICIPYKDPEQFVEAVTEGLHGFDLEIVIIHSTVATGTTRLVSKAFKTPVAHSFCRGIHPDLVEGLKVFQKAVGGIDEESTELAGDHLQSLGICIQKLSSPEASECAKLLSTTYYGYSILFAKAAAKLCDDHDLDYEEVYTWSNETYNDGYRRLGKEQFIRPVLFPPKGRIGGHCVVPNFHLLPNSELKNFCIKQEEAVCE